VFAQPWAVQIEARAKWDAWNALKGMSKEKAMQEYIDYLAKGDPNWEQHEVLKGYSE
jgi:diazepam-binding inhibitor (GABA receptor modulating acyl-CoA-binding protein)